MVVGNSIGERSFRLIVSIVILLTFDAILTCDLVSAQQRRTGGPTPSPEGAAVYFVGLNDGATLPTKMTIHFGLRDMGVAPAGLDRANSGHHHLLINDSDLPQGLAGALVARWHQGGPVLRATGPVAR
jgi:Domain of unknown function (DUF4399)